MLRQLIATVALITAFVAAPAIAQTSGEAPMINTNATAKVNSVELHCDIVGNGTPLALLHG